LHRPAGDLPNTSVTPGDIPSNPKSKIENPMSRSRLLVISFLVVVIAMLFGLRWYTNERGKQEKLAAVQCDSLLPTVFELQGERVPVSRERTCELMRTISAMQPTADEFHNDSNDPWHYYGRMRILPKNDAWFLIFIARRSSNFRPEFSLQHRRGAGWTVVGQFDAEPVLRMLDAVPRLDTTKLRSSESLTPIDQNQPM
jgi:hypothetical protein